MVPVSIGMPVYNAEKYLDGAIAALSSQTFSDFRLIISDNASTDATPDIIADWVARDSRISLHRQSENMGAAYNYEWLLRSVDSPWFMFAAYDDLWSPNYVEVLYAAATQRQGTRLAAPQVVMMSCDGAESRHSPFYDPISGLVGLGRIRTLLYRVRSAWFYGLFSRQALLSAWDASSDFQYTWAKDFLILLPFLLSGDVAGNSDAVFYQRETGISAAQYKPRTLEAQKDLFATFLRVSMRMLREAHPKRINRLMLLSSMLSYTNRNAWKLRRLIRSELKRLFMRRES